MDDSSSSTPRTLLQGFMDQASPHETPLPFKQIAGQSQTLGGVRTVLRTSLLKRRSDAGTTSPRHKGYSQLAVRHLSKRNVQNAAQKLNKSNDSEMTSEKDHRDYRKKITQKKQELFQRQSKSVLMSSSVQEDGVGHTDGNITIANATYANISQNSSDGSILEQKEIIREKKRRKLAGTALSARTARQAVPPGDTTVEAAELTHADATYADLSVADSFGDDTLELEKARIANRRKHNYRDVYPSSQPIAKISQMSDVASKTWNVTMPADHTYSGVGNVSGSSDDSINIEAIRTRKGRMENIFSTKRKVNRLESDDLPPSKLMRSELSSAVSIDNTYAVEELGMSSSDDSIDKDQVRDRRAQRGLARQMASDRSRGAEVAAASPRRSLVKSVASPRRSLVKSVASPRESPRKLVASPQGSPKKSVASPRGSPTKSVASPGRSPTKPVASPGGSPTKSVASPGGSPTKSVASPGGSPTKSVASPQGSPKKSVASPRGSPKKSVASHQGSPRKLPLVSLKKSIASPLAPSRKSTPSPTVTLARLIGSPEMSQNGLIVSSESYPRNATIPSQLSLNKSSASLQSSEKKITESQLFPRKSASPQLSPRKSTASPRLSPRKSTASLRLSPRKSTASPRLSPRKSTASPQLSPRKSTASPQLSPSKSTDSVKLPPRKGTVSQLFSENSEQLLSRVSNSSDSPTQSDRTGLTLSVAFNNAAHRSTKDSTDGTLTKSLLNISSQTVPGGLDFDDSSRESEGVNSLSLPSTARGIQDASPKGLPHSEAANSMVSDSSIVAASQDAAKRRQLVSLTHTKANIDMSALIGNALKLQPYKDLNRVVKNSEQDSDHDTTDEDAVPESPQNINFAPSGMIAPNSRKRTSLGNYSTSVDYFVSHTNDQDSLVPPPFEFDDSTNRPNNSPVVSLRSSPRKSLTTNVIMDVVVPGNSVTNISRHVEASPENTSDNLFDSSGKKVVHDIISLPSDRDRLGYKDMKRYSAVHSLNENVISSNSPVLQMDASASSRRSLFSSKNLSSAAVLTADNFKSSPSKMPNSPTKLRQSNEGGGLVQDLMGDWTETDESPNSRIMSRRSKTMSPSLKTMSPRSKTMSPRSKTMSPRSKTMSPRSKTMSPRSKTMSPRSKTMSPRSKTMSPRSKTTSPRLMTMSPSSKTMSPRSKTMSPRSKAMSPSTKTMSPSSMGEPSSPKTATPSVMSLTRSDTRQVKTPKAGNSSTVISSGPKQTTLKDFLKVLSRQDYVQTYMTSDFKETKKQMLNILNNVTEKPSSEKIPRLPAPPRIKPVKPKEWSTLPYQYHREAFNHFSKRKNSKAVIKEVVKASEVFFANTITDAMKIATVNAHRSVQASDVVYLLRKHGLVDDVDGEHSLRALVEEFLPMDEWPHRNIKNTNKINFSR